jgi:hypothetical protein
MNFKLKQPNTNNEWNCEKKATPTKTQQFFIWNFGFLMLEGDNNWSLLQ